MNTTKKTLQLYWHHVKKYPHLFIPAAILTPLAIVTHQYLPPLVIANVLDRLSRGDFVAGDLWGSFGGDILLFAALFITGSVILWRIADLFVWRLEFLIVRDISRRVFSHLIEQSARFHADHFGGSLVSQTSKLISSYIRFADSTIFNVTSLIVAFGATTVILFPHVPLFVAALYGFAVLYILIATLTTKKVRQLAAKDAAAMSRQTGYLADSVTNVMTIKSFASSKYENAQFAERTDETRSAGLKMMNALILRDFYFTNVNALVMITSLTVATASVVVFGASDIATVFLIFTYTTNVSRQLWEFSTRVLRNYNRAFGDAKEMTEILNQDTDVKDPATPEPVHIQQGAIDFQNITFAHDDDKNDQLFESFNLHIAAGERIGLVGHSGSGKTTLTKLLLRFADIDKGAITIDGQNIAHITQDDLRRHIAYVAQEPLLFHRSLRENIAYGKIGATEEEIHDAAKKAHAAEFINKLPDGYDTMVGERGVKLSGGQRQRIAIARAILKDAPILVLDEATSALDSESEKLIQAALWELMKNRTAIVIAHRLSTIQKMDRIVVLEDGKIVEQGTHAELLNKKGVYADLWSHQSGGFIEE